MRNIAIMGSTGSIGRQTLDIVSEYPDLFKAWVLVANNSADLLIEQALKYRPHTVVIANEALYDKVKTALADTDIEEMCIRDSLPSAPSLVRNRHRQKG